MNPTTITARYNDLAFHAECWSLSQFGGKIKAMTLAGKLRELRPVTEGLGEDARYLLGQAKDQLSPCDHGYRVAASKVLMKDFVVIHIRSLDPRCIWTDEPAELFAALMNRPYETPLLQRWMKAFRMALEIRKLIFPMAGFNPQGRVLSPELTPRKLDELATKGVSEKKLNLR